MLRDAEKRAIVIVPLSASMGQYTPLLINIFRDFLDLLARGGLNHRGNRLILALFCLAFIRLFIKSVSSKEAKKEINLLSL